MRLKTTIYPWKILAFVFVFDCAVMPVMKVGGLSFKISYLIAFGSIALLLSNSLLNGRTMLNGIGKVLRSLTWYIVLLFLGQFWAMLFYEIPMETEFWKIVIGSVLMVGSVYFGYKCKADIGKIAYWSFVINIVINCILALLGEEAPAFLTSLYSIAVETYIDGYYRNGGMIGNPNATLLVTNMMLLLIIVLYKFDKIKLSNIKIASVYMLSIAADIIVSSRGELLQTIGLLVYFTYLQVKKNPDVTKLFTRMVAVVGIIVLTIALFWGDIVEQYPNIEQSWERMTSLADVMDTSAEDADVSSIARPFLRTDKFWNRFKHSPIWGTGIEGGGTHADFSDGTTGYHNDFYMILASAGILGFLLWLGIIKFAVKKIGWCMLAPFVVTAISNTFVRSYFGTMIYFFIIGYVLYLQEVSQDSQKPLRSKENEKNYLFYRKP